MHPPTKMRARCPEKNISRLFPPQNHFWWLWDSKLSTFCQFLPPLPPSSVCYANSLLNFGTQGHEKWSWGTENASQYAFQVRVCTCFGGWWWGGHFTPPVTFFDKKYFILHFRRKLKQIIKLDLRRGHFGWNKGKINRNFPVPVSCSYCNLFRVVFIR